MASTRTNSFAVGERVRHIVTERHGVVVAARDGHPPVLRVRFDGAVADFIANPLELVREKPDG